MKRLGYMKNKCTYMKICFLLFSLSLINSCTGQEKANVPQRRIIKLNAIPDDTSVTETPLASSALRTTFVQYHSNLDGMVREFVRKMYQDKSGNFWFGTNGDGVIRYNGASLEKFTINEQFGGIAVRGIVEDKAGNVWFGTSGGLSKYDGESFTNFSEKDGLLNNEIWGLAMDRNGLIWIGTIEGVCLFDGKLFTNFSIPRAEVRNPQSMLSENRVSRIMEDRKGDMWFVTDGYGICIYDGKSFRHLTKKDGLPDNNVADLLEDTQGDIWIGTFFGGVSRYDGKSFINYTENGIIEGIETYNLCEDRNGYIWFSAENFGVYRYDGNSFTQFTTKDGLATNTIQSIFEDDKGQLWFGTWSGLSLYDGNSFFNVKDKEPWTK